MAHLADLLGHDHPLFVYNLAQLEKAAGNSGVDVRLLADINQRAVSAMRALGLDVTDTFPDELYQALNAAVRRGDAKDILGETDYVLFMTEGEPVSFNLRDVTANVDRQLPFVERSLEAARRSLRAEIIRRYAEHDRTDNDIVRRLLAEAGIDIPDDEPDNSKLKSAKKTKSKKEKAMTEEKVPHVLCVGDINTNAFIQLTEDHVGLETDDAGYKRITLELGGKLPYDGVDVLKVNECSPNAAVSLARLGLRAELMTWVGGDEVGKEMIEYLKQEGVGTDNIVVDQDQKSNYHYVLRYGADRTKLQRFEDFSYQWVDPAEKPDWLYLGVLGEDTWELHQSILRYLEANPEIKLVFQPGMYHLMWGAEKLAEFYRRAEVVIMNREEAAQVTGKERGDVGVLIQGLHDLGVTVAVVTDGADGAYASEGDGIKFMPNYPDVAPPFERTGAGDAFASTLTAALALGESLETALTWAPINSMNVVQKIGAQEGLQTRAQLEDWLAKAPEDYRVTEFGQ